jgi:hypothetical protein
VRVIGERIGLYRVAAILVGCALVLEVIRAQLLDADSPAGVACTVGEVALLAFAAGIFVAARRGR